jgi:hypothetical protein
MISSWLSSLVAPPATITAAEAATIIAVAAESAAKPKHDIRPIVVGWAIIRLVAWIAVDGHDRAFINRRRGHSHDRGRMHRSVRLDDTTGQ